MRWLTFLLAAALAFCSCSSSSSPESSTVRLVDLFGEDMVEGGPSSPPAPPPRTEWRFEGADESSFEVFANVAGLAVREEALTGRSTSDLPVLHVERTSGLESRDQLHAVEIRARVSEGANLAVQFAGGEELNRDQMMGMMAAFDWEMTTPILPGDDVQAYTLRSPRPITARSTRHLLLRPTDVAGATFAIESIRLVFRREYLAEIESGISFQGMSEIYRESIVSRAPETIRVPLDVPAEPLLDLAVGIVDDVPVTFQVAIETEGGEQPLLERTLTTPYRWEPAAIDLSRYTGRSVSLLLSLESAEEGAIGVWGSPVLRSRAAFPPRGAPRNVILLWTDTLRPDHLDAYGYERATAPVLKRMASEGALFEHNVSQATWTKVSTPSVMTSLYPSTHGVKDFPDYLPASARTLAEVYRDAGYATVSYASNLFTGQFTNLHQGFEELHEDGSLSTPGSSKTSREYVDRFTEWMERNRDVPFFAFLHLYDPHDPFEPYAPYDTMWADAETRERHEEELEKVRRYIEEPLARAFGMPSRAELEAAGIDAEAYVGYDVDWYDGSIRGMDAEIGRILERLEMLELDEDTLVVFIADHGEEFLDHGRTFHGHSVYGELTRVPLLMRWPRGIEPGRRIDAVTQTVDVMPTLLSLSGLPVPEEAQGTSLVPLLKDDGSWQSRPAVAEKAKTVSGRGAPWPEHTESYAIVDGSWKLVHHVERDEGVPEYELFDVVKDPLDQSNVAAQHPDVVERLSAALDGWKKMADAAKLAPDSESTEGLSQQQLERLRSLGYIR